jgi:hypothetical protein
MRHHYNPESLGRREGSAKSVYLNSACDGWESKQIQIPKPRFAESCLISPNCRLFPAGAPSLYDQNRNQVDPATWKFVRAASQNYTVSFTKVHDPPAVLTCPAIAGNVDARRPGGPEAAGADAYTC